MKLHITLSEERFRQLMRDAYADGFEDGAGAYVTEGRTGADLIEKEWPISVTEDVVRNVIETVRKGGRV